MKSRSSWMCAMAAGGILAGAVAAYLRRHEPAARRAYPVERVDRTDASPNAPRMWHPWVRITRAFRSLLNTRWDAKTWPITKAEMAKALELRRQIRRAGWFN